ncbi:TadE/TadG family type IV pilus assembly protein [Microbacterium sp. 4NA327F11]|uniref:TadE/TadG family type IV pilus assembly protein n=1 Tax=Microbacterium sp. 4NA327F11 TaxID=2502229 RepID=UPI0032D5797F
MLRRWRDDEGSAAAEFVMVGALLTVLTLAVLQFALAVYVRNVVQDAASEGAHVAALADATPGDGEARTRDAITRAVGGGLIDEIRVATSAEAGFPTVRVTVSATFPVIGLVGIPGAMEVTGDAPLESFD